MTVVEFNEIVWDYGVNGTDGICSSYSDSLRQIVACAWRDAGIAEKHGESQDEAINAYFNDFLSEQKKEIKASLKDKLHEIAFSAWDVLKTHLSFDDWYNECFRECMDEAADMIFNGSCNLEKGSFFEIGKTISKDGNPHTIDVDKNELLEFFGKDYFTVE